MEIKWHRSASIVSTNTYLTELAGGDSGFDYEVAVAGFQTGGRGQRGNTWESQPGKNLLFSILAHPSSIDVTRQFFISQAIALAVSDCVCEYLGPELGRYVSVKWPNDIYWKDFKMAGILIEHTVMGRSIQHSVVGVGLDVNQTVFESDAPNPVSMAMVAGHEFNLEPLLQSVVACFIEYMGRYTSEEMQKTDRRYHDRMYRGTGFHQFRDINGLFKARICNVEPNGCLVLETDGGEKRTYEFKQVQFVIPSKK
ncbi:MAG: biotin--[acetyl-CoA-carboxylase] ligase [Bacteroidaceae bacterium]|nr:biotin--[acetyl-CoA-carboxylase] ligase [Bacteroidaceae bacterium]